MVLCLLPAANTLYALVCPIRIDQSSVTSVSHDRHGRVIADPKVTALYGWLYFCKFNELHVCSSLPTVMASDPSDIWSPNQGTTTFTDTFSPTRQSYSSQSGIFLNS